MRRTLLPLTLVLAAVFCGPAKAEETGSAPVPPDGWQSRPIRLPPFFWYERDFTRQRKLFMLSMLYWDARDEKTSHKLLLPVFYQWKEDTRSLLVTLPLLVSYGSPEDRWLLAGPFYRQSNADRTRTVFFPLFWQQANRRAGRATIALPFVFYDYRSPRGPRSDTVSLLGWSRARPEKRMGLVLNHWWSIEENAQFRTLLPLYWHWGSPGDHTRVLVPFYSRRQSVRPVFPGKDDSPYFHPKLKEDQPADNAYRRWVGVMPLAGAGWGPGLSSHYLFPLYSYSRNDRRRALLTLPFSAIRNEDARQGHLGLYYYARDPDNRAQGFFPLWHQSASTDGFEAKTNFLLYASRLENDDYFQTVIPLYGYWSSPDRKEFLSWLMWRKRERGTVTGVLPLYYWKHSSDESTRVLFPLYWHYRRDPDWGLDVFFPFYTRYRDGPMSITMIPPVITRKIGDRRTWSLFFLYWRDKDVTRGSTSVFPLFVDAYSPGRRMFFSPILWKRRSPLSREGLLPPVYWYRSAVARRTIVFPLVWSSSSPHKGMRIIPPYYRLTSEEKLSYGVFPFWGRHMGAKERGGYLLPFYWYTGDGKGNGFWIIPPILGTVARRGVNTDNPRFSMQYLLFGNISKSTDTFSHEFFPLYKYVRVRDFRNFWTPRVIALAAWERDRHYAKGIIVPFLWRRGPDKDWFLMIPLWYKSRTYEVRKSSESDVPPVRQERIGGSTFLFPLYAAGRKHEKAWRYVAPLYWSFEDGPRRTQMFAPLWFSHNSARGGKGRVLFPLYWRFLVLGSTSTADIERRHDKRDIRVWGPWYRIDTWQGERVSRTAGLAPFFSNTSSGPDDKYFEVFGGLFARDVQEGKRRFRFFYLFYTKPKLLTEG